MVRRRFVGKADIEDFSRIGLTKDGIQAPLRTTRTNKLLFNEISVCNSTRNFLVLMMVVTSFHLFHRFSPLEPNASVLSLVESSSKFDSYDHDRNLPSKTKSNHPSLKLQQQQQSDDNIERKIEAQNDMIPGEFLNGTIYILGARLTTSFAADDESVSFDVFAHGTGEGTRKNSKYSNLPPDSTLLSYRDASSLPMFCQTASMKDTARTTHNDLVPMKLITLLNRDRNTQGNTLIWRCNITDTFTKSNILRLDANQSVTIQFLKNQDLVVRVDIPISTGAVGYSGPTIMKGKGNQNHDKDGTFSSFVSQVAQSGPVGIVLCVGGINNIGLHLLPEFIQHHINVGVGHIVVGIDDEADSKLMKDAQSLLSHFINDEGGNIVALMPMHHVAKRYGGSHYELRKLNFYNQCLYHAKGMSEFMALWDLDEHWMPPSLSSYAENQSSTQLSLAQAANEWDTAAINYRPAQHDDLWYNSTYARSWSLPKVARMIRGPNNNCTDWCYQSFPSFTVDKYKFQILRGKRRRTLLYQGLYGYGTRSKKPNWNYQKSITQTKYAFSTSPHVSGSCYTPAMPITTDSDGKRKRGANFVADFKECPLTVERNDDFGSMRHFRQLVHYRFLNRMNDTTQDEYETYMRHTTMQQLAKLYTISEDFQIIPIPKEQKDDSKMNELFTVK